MSLPTQEDIQQSLATLKNDATLSQKDFANIVTAFAYHPEQGKFLLETNSVNEKLAETLLVFRRKLAEAIKQEKDLAPLIDHIFLHYVINTDGPIIESEGSDPFDVFDALTRYAELIGVGVSKDAEGNSILHIDEKEIVCPQWQTVPGFSAAWSLRDAGPVINRARYGRNDVIPSTVFHFDENAATHTLENAMTLADFAHLAYFKPAYVQKQLKAWGYDSFDWIENQDTDTQVFLAGKDEHLVVCFRGTSSFKDVLVDLNFFKTEAFGGVGKVHRGFQRALDSVWNKVKDAADKMGVKKKLFVCGHSLGAALAQLAAHRFALAGYHVSHVYVFGSPRVANREFMEHYNELLAAKTFLHINNKDIVTTVPLALLGFHYLGDKPRSFNNGHVITSVTDDMEGQQLGEKETPFEKLDAQTQEDIRQQMYQLEQSIHASTKFLTTNPSQLNFGSYATQFEAGAMDEHSMDQYLFKFACAIVDGDWVKFGKPAAVANE
jgi:hypothetical protein